MAELNAIDCLAIVKNTGYGDCVVDPGKLVGAIEIPKGYRFSAADLVDFAATLRAGVNNPNKALRFYPIGGWVAATDNSEDLVVETLGYGVPVPVRDGNYDWTFQYIKGGICLSNALRTRNGVSNKDYLFYDDKGLILGTRQVNGTSGELEFGGVSPEYFYALKWTINNGTNVSGYRVRFVMEPNQLNEGLGFVKVPGFTPATLMGLQNINLVSAAAPAAGVSQIKALSGCSQTNLYDLYSTELAAAALWVAYNAATGGEIDITSVVANPGLKAFTVTLDSTDTDYPATAAGLVRIELADVAALAAAGIIGYEGLPVTIQRG